MKLAETVKVRGSQHIFKGHILHNYIYFQITFTYHFGIKNSRCVQQNKPNK